jgi:hypothetical protein
MSKQFAWLLIAILVILSLLVTGHLPEPVGAEALHTVYLPVIANPGNDLPQSRPLVYLTCGYKTMIVGTDDSFPLQGTRVSDDHWIVDAPPDNSGVDYFMVMVSEKYGQYCTVQVFNASGVLELDGAATRTEVLWDVQMDDMYDYVWSGDGLYIRLCIDSQYCDTIVRYEIELPYEFELQCDGFVYLRAGSAPGLAMHGWKVDDSWRYVIDDRIPEEVVFYTTRNPTHSCQIKYLYMDGSQRTVGAAVQEYYGGVTRDQRDLMWHDEGLWISMCYEDDTCDLAMFWIIE